jgi:hypothetical protein
MSSDIKNIVESWIDRNMGHLQSYWDEAGGESGGFADLLQDIAREIASEVECDLDSIVMDHLSNQRQWEIEEMIESRIDEIEQEGYGW